MKCIRSHTFTKSLTTLKNWLVECHRLSIDSATNPTNAQPFGVFWVFPLKSVLVFGSSPDTLGAVCLMTSFTSPFLSIWHVPGRGFFPSGSEMSKPWETWVPASIQFKWLTELEQDRSGFYHICHVSVKMLWRVKNLRKYSPVIFMINDHPVAIEFHYNSAQRYGI